MDNEIQTLYKSLHSVSVEYLTGINRDNIKKIRKLVPQIQCFATSFLEGNTFGIEQRLYQELSEGLLLILKDITEALKEEDHVLLHDAIGYGLLEYLKLFVGQEEESDDGL